MKTLVAVLLCASSLVFAGMYAWQKSKATAAEKKAAQLAKEVTAAQTEVAEHQERTVALQTRLQNVQAKAVAKADEVVHLQQVLTNQAETNGKTGNPLAEMFKSPEMKELMKAQQKTIMSTMLDKTYGPYLSSLQMTAEQAATFKDLLNKRNLVDMDLGMSMLGGDSDPAKRKELADQAKAEKNGIDQQIRQFLGDDNYTQFQNYEKTIPERMQLSLYKDQQGSGPGALLPDQEDKLVQVMSEEREKFKFTTDFNDKSKFNGDFSAMFTEEKLSQFETEQAQLDQQYLARAKGILSPEQLGPFEEFLNNRRSMQTAAMKMASKMFAPKPVGN